MMSGTSASSACLLAESTSQLLTLTTPQVQTASRSTPVKSASTVVVEVPVSTVALPTASRSHSVVETSAIQGLPESSTSAPSQAGKTAAAGSQPASPETPASPTSLSPQATGQHSAQISTIDQPVPAATSTRQVGGAQTSSSALSSETYESSDFLFPTAGAPAPSADLSITSQKTITTFKGDLGSKTPVTTDVSSVHSLKGTANSSLTAFTTSVGPASTSARHKISQASISVMSAVFSTISVSVETPTTYVLTTMSSGSTFHLTRQSHVATTLAAPSDLQTPGQSTIYSSMTLTLTTASPSAPTNGSSTYLHQTNDIVSQSYVKLSGPFTKIDYFNALYLGPIIGVILKMTWDAIYGDIKLMEPFYRLASPDGATAGASLLMNYLDCGFGWASLGGIFKGQWAMTLASAIYVLTSLIAPLASESMTVRAQSICRTELSDRQPCDPAWILVKLVIRCLEAVLLSSAALVIAYTFYNLPRKSGLMESPATLAGIAKLLNDRRTIQNLRLVDPKVSSKRLEQSITRDRFALVSRETADGEIVRGIVQIGRSRPGGGSSNMEQTNPLSRSGQASYTLLPTPEDVAVRSQQSPSMLKRAVPFLIDIVVVIFTMGLFGVVMAYYWDYKPDPFNNFFNSNGFGPRLTLSFSAVILDAHWKRIEREVRVLTPWRQMAVTRKNHSAPASKSIFARMTGTPIVSFPRAIRRRSVFHAWVSLVAILSDVNILAVSAVPYNDATIEIQFKVASFVSLAILGTMTVTLVAVWIWRWASPTRGMPRSPDTLAAIALYLCGSKMIAGEASSVDNRHAYKKFWFGEGVGLDGRQRWMVDWDSASLMMADDRRGRQPEGQHSDEWY